jgi:hypothetical protein
MQWKVRIQKNDSKQWRYKELYILTPWPESRERTIPTERPPLVGEVSANFCGYSGAAWWARQILYGRNLGFLDRAVTFVFFQVASPGWVDTVPDPLLLRKSGRAGNRTRTSGSVAGNSDHQTTEAVYFLLHNIYKFSSYFTENTIHRISPFCSQELWPPSHRGGRLQTHKLEIWPVNCDVLSDGRQPPHWKRYPGKSRNCRNSFNITAVLVRNEKRSDVRNNKRSQIHVAVRPESTRILLVSKTQVYRGIQLSKSSIRSGSYRV